MAQTFLGIDLGSYSVKIAQLERGFGEFKLVNFFEVPLVAEEILTYQESASAALNKFISENPIPFDTCVLSLPANVVSFRTLELPFDNPKKIAQTLEFELESLIPFEIEDLLFDYALVESGKGISKALTTYIPEHAFGDFLKRIEKTGLEPRYIGVDATDLSFLPNLGVLPPQGRYAILDLGHTKTNFIFMDGGKVKTVRSFSWGGDRLTRTIERVGKMDYEAGERFKHSQAKVQKGSSNEILAALYKEFEDFGLQIRQTLFAFYESGEEPLEALYLCGGTSRMSGVESFFSALLNVNVSSLDVLDDSYTELRERERARPIIPTALGAALHGVFPNKGLKFNFRQGVYAYKKDMEQLGGTLKKIGVMAASVVGIGLIYFFIAYSSLSSQVETMNRDVTKLVKSSVKDIPKKGMQSTKSALAMLDTKIAGLNDRLKLAEGGGGMSSLQILKLVSGAMPPRDQLTMEVDDLNITPDRVRVEGRVNSYEAVDKIKSSIEKVPQFKNVQTGNVRKGIKDEIKFSLSFDIAGAEEGS
jgi:type IV pilus assembly protein PilM